MQKLTNITIRRYRTEDAAAVSNLIQRTMLQSNSHDYSMDILKPLHDYFTPEKVDILASERYCLIAIMDIEIVGTGALEDGELKTIFVLPDYQGKGIGTQIVLKLEEQALKMGINLLKVPASKTGRLFYEVMGYIGGASFESEYAGEQIWMEKEL